MFSWPLLVVTATPNHLAFQQEEGIETAVIIHSPWMDREVEE